MAEWPNVTAVEGIAGTLDRLASHYLLALATNADDSGAELVRRALRRVGLADRFPVVIASCEVGHRKPERAFFAALASALRCRPEEIVMVGDDYGRDVVGAHAAGLRSVWFDRTGDREPPLPAAHDGRITAMDELPAVIASLDARR
jgi:putative hydrolase of the HAD superfamily